MKVLVRQEKPEDRAAVSAVVARAFEDMAESDHQEHFLVERLRDSEAFLPALSLVAELENGRIAGYILLTKSEIVSAEKTIPVLALAPLAVLPDFQNQGIGTALITRAHEIAAHSGFGLSVLLGHPTYYPKFGYRKASDYGISFPFDAPDDCALVKALRPGALRGVSGVVRYPKAFFQEG